MPKLTNKISAFAIALITLFAITPNATAGGILFVDDDAAAGGDGARWETAYRFLQDALTDASSGGISEIHVAQGTYNPTQEEAFPNGTGFRGAFFYLLNSMALMGGYAGIGAKDPDVRDIELYETILSGDLLGNDHGFFNNDENSYHVVKGRGADDTALLEGFTITAGNANSNFGSNRGGGFFAFPSDATINRCKFEANSSFLQGGGFYSEDGSLALTNCAFVGNQSFIGGGATFAFDKFGSPTVDNCTFTDNLAKNGGAGLQCTGSFIDGATISNCTFDSNTVTGPSNSATAGGGLSVFSSSSELQIINCTFIDNTANNIGYALGGAMGIVQAECRVVNCDFLGNSANGKVMGKGGAVYVQSGNPQFINCLVTENTADLGGGIENSFGGTSTYVNCTITGNTATTLAGAAHSQDNCEPMFTNCNIWDNGPNPIVDEEDAVTTVDYSNVQGGWAGAGSNNIDADPMFVDPGNGDYRLASGSPCIDAGHNWYVPVDANDFDEDGILCELFPVDLDGNPRFNADDVDFDPGCGIPVVVDMGAYEYQFDPVDQITFADLNGDNAVSTADLLFLFASWGDCDKGCCLADLDLDGIVNTADLLLLFTNWGTCK